ncbi:MAG: hypothetical protein AAGA93_23595 [Actinomycetota bacterium]
MSTTYFAVTDAKKLPKDRLRLIGQYILDGSTTVTSASSQTDDDDDKYPPIDISIPGPFEVKWILPARDSQVYGAVKWFAESMGYETVELDDFSYPPPRV